MDFISLSEVYFLCNYLSMKNIFNLYLSSDDKDILWEIQRLEENDATLSNYAELFKLSANASALCGPLDAVAEPVSANC